MPATIRRVQSRPHVAGPAAQTIASIDKLIEETLEAARVVDEHAPGLGLKPALRLPSFRARICLQLIRQSTGEFQRVSAAGREQRRQIAQFAIDDQVRKEAATGAFLTPRDQKEARASREAALEARATRALRDRVEEKYRARCESAVRNLVEARRAAREAVDAVEAKTILPSAYLLGDDKQLRARGIGDECKARGVAYTVDLYEHALRSEDRTLQHLIVAGCSLWLRELVVGGPRAVLARTYQPTRERRDEVQRDAERARVLLLAFERAAEQRVPPVLQLAREIIGMQDFIFSKTVGLDFTPGVGNVDGPTMARAMSGSFRLDPDAVADAWIGRYFGGAGGEVRPPLPWQTFDPRSGAFRPLPAALARRA